MSGDYHNDGQCFLVGGIGDSCLNLVGESDEREGLSEFPSRGTERAYQGLRRWLAPEQAGVLERRKSSNTHQQNAVALTVARWNSTWLRTCSAHFTRTLMESWTFSSMSVFKMRSAENTSELQSIMCLSHAV